MAQIKSTILFTGNEDPKEFVQKITDLQRQFDNRITASEKRIVELKNRISELED